MGGSKGRGGALQNDAADEQQREQAQAHEPEHRQPGQPGWFHRTVPFVRSEPYTGTNTLVSRVEAPKPQAATQVSLCRGESRVINSSMQTHYKGLPSPLFSRTPGIQFEWSAQN